MLMVYLFTKKGIIYELEYDDTDESGKESQKRMGINVIAKKRDENYIFIKTNMEIIFTIAHSTCEMLYKFKKRERRETFL
jgi:hypothetical protein